MGSQVKVRQRRPWKSCELDMPKTLDPLKRFEPELTQILTTVARRVDRVFTVIGSKVKVTDNI